MHNNYACKGVFNPNIPIFPPNSAEGLHFSAFHYYGFEIDFEIRARTANSANFGKIQVFRLNCAEGILQCRRPLLNCAEGIPQCRRPLLNTRKTSL